MKKTLIWLCLLLVPLGAAIAKDNELAPKDGAKAVRTKREAKPSKAARLKQKAKTAEGAEPNKGAKPAEAKELSGISILGNDEAPKALYIVPWKKSEMGAETSLNMMLTESAGPVDREVFMRQLDFYELSTKK